MPVSESLTWRSAGLVAPIPRRRRNQKRYPFLMPKSKGRRKPKRVINTPPPPKEVKVSPTWYVVLMFTMMAIGVIVIILNYIDLMPLDDPINWLYVGLGSIGVGFMMTLNFN